jgi:plasmid stability protein
VATLTVRNVPDDAKHRFRQVAAAHGRSMEEHLRQLVIGADVADETPVPTGVSDVRQSFRHEPLAIGSQKSDQAARIRAMSSAEFFKYLVETAGGMGLDLPPRANFPKDREVFGAD